MELKRIGLGDDVSFTCVYELEVGLVRLLNNRGGKLLYNPVINRLIDTGAVNQSSLHCVFSQEGVHVLWQLNDPVVRAGARPVIWSGTALRTKKEKSWSS